MQLTNTLTLSDYRHCQLKLMKFCSGANMDKVEAAFNFKLEKQLHVFFPGAVSRKVKWYHNWQKALMHNDRWGRNLLKRSFLTSQREDVRKWWFNLLWKIVRYRTSHLRESTGKPYVAIDWARSTIMLLRARYVLLNPLKIFEAESMTFRQSRHPSQRSQSG